MSRFYITTAIPYANGAPHIGHAYERIATDAIQRFMRLDGRETLFVTGMDEHGLKVQQTAAREGVTPQEFVDRVAGRIRGDGRAPERAAPTTSCARRKPRNVARRAGDLGADGGQRRHLPVEIFRLVFGARRGLFRRERTQPTARTERSSRRPARRSNGSRRRATSSASRPMPTGCSRITRRIRISSRRRNIATRSSPS